MSAVKPYLTSYGNSVTVYQGNTLESGMPKGLINTSSLGNVLYSEDIELNSFEKSVRDFCLARLGFPIVRVELHPYQIKTAIDEAYAKINYYTPLWTTQFATFEASAGMSLYEIPRYILDSLVYVYYRKTLLSLQHANGTIEQDFFLKYFQDNFLFSNMAVSDYYLMLSYLKTIRKVLGNEGSWNVIDNQYLQLYPVPVQTPEEVIIEFRALNTETMHSYYKNWIQRYALAVCKGMLANIRGKYLDIPSPAGGAKMNWELLARDSEREMEALEIELRDAIAGPATFTIY